MADKGTEMVELMTQKGMGEEMSALISLLVMVYGEREGIKVVVGRVGYQSQSEDCCFLFFCFGQDHMISF